MNKILSILVFLSCIVLYKEMYVHYTNNNLSSAIDYVACWLGFVGIMVLFTYGIYLVNVDCKKIV